MAIGLETIQNLLYRLYMLVTWKNPELYLRDMFFLGKPGETFSNDDSLPSLPVPELEGTLKKYLDSVRPHVTDLEFARTTEIVNEFGRGLGQQLQKQLLEKASRERNWLTKWWEDAAYLTSRAPLLPNLNMVGGMPERFANPNKENWLKLSSLYLYYFLQFWKLVRSEQLKAFYSGKTPWSNHQFKNVFSTVRIPGMGKDELKCYFNPLSSGKSSPTHIAVFCRGHVFSMEALDQDEGLLTPPELEKQLTIIYESCMASGPGSGVGALTATERTTWAKNRAILSELDPNNKQILDTIDSSIAALCLDEKEPATPNEATRLEFISDCKNRWADKSCTIQIFRNGMIGASADHAPIDGMTCMMLINYTYMSVTAHSSTWKGTKTIRDMKPPKELKFRVNDYLHREIEVASKDHRQRGKNLQVKMDNLNLYGKAFIKPCRIHPDVFLQLIIQLAFYRMHGRIAPTYMSVSTRQFYQGRTETCRSCTNEVVQWMKSMQNEAVSDAERHRLLYIAAEHLLKLRQECMKANGCDRHLLGLYMAALESGLPVPDLFQDPSYLKSGGGGNFTLSSSFTGYSEVVGGVGAMTEDGYSIFYSIEENRIYFLMTAYNSCSETCCDKYFAQIGNTLRDVRQLLNNTKHLNVKS